MEGILENDPKILGRLVEDMLPMVKALVEKNGGTIDDSKDVFQDAILAVYDKVKQKDFKLRSKFSTYFYGICRNIWGNRLQKKSSSEVAIPEHAKYIAGEDYGLDYEEIERRALRDKAFALLEKDCQEVLLLYYQKIKMKKIAEIMGYKSEGYARRKKGICVEYLVKFAKQQAGYQELCNY